MTGRPLKAPEQRRNRTKPQQGEWIDLPERLERRVLGPYRAEFTVPRFMWNAWRRDPLTSQYGQSDIALITYLALRFEAMEDSERRMLFDRLGLSPKARRDLRWRTQLEARQQQEAAQKVADIRRLRVVAEKE